MNKILTIASLAVLLSFISCNEETPQNNSHVTETNELIIDGMSLNIDDGKIYRADYTIYRGFLPAYNARLLIFTDGTIVDTDHSLDILSSAYSGATYVFYFRLGVNLDEMITSGTYLIYESIDDKNENEKSIFLSHDSDDSQWMFTQGVTEGQAVEISFSEENDVVLAFEGNLHSGNEISRTVKFTLSGEMVDFNY